MFETTGIINEALLRSIKQYLISPRQKKVYVIMVIAALVLACLFAWLHDGMWLFVCLALAVVIVVEYSMLGARYVRLNLQRMGESVGETATTISSWLDDEGVHIRNHATGGSGCVPYEALAVLEETEQVYLLFTQARQMVCIFKDQLDALQQQALLEYLKSKPTGIKW